MVSHAGGIAAGVLAHIFGKWLRAPAKRSKFTMSRADYFKGKFPKLTAQKAA
jgi:hypothetical protein